MFTILGKIGYPLFDIEIAGSKTSLNFFVPYFNNNSIQASKAPGTTADRRPLPGIISKSMLLKKDKLALFGATPCPQITSGSLLKGDKIIGTSPPGPFKCGSTT